MKRFALLLLLLAACRPDGVTRAYGELVFVQGDRELTDATYTLPSVVMTETGSSTLTLRNVGRVAAGIVSITRDDGDASLSVAGAGLSIAENTEGTLTVTFAPGQAADVTQASVTHTAHFTLKLSGTADGKDTLNLTLVASALARDCYVPAVLDFGRVPLNYAVTKSATLQNGALVASQSSWSFSSSFFTVLTVSPLDIAAQGSGQLTVQFQPLEARSYAETLTVSRGGSCPAGAMTLQGVGDDTAITWAPSPLQFGRVPLGDISTREVVVTNHSSVDLSLAPSIASSNFFVEPGAPTVLPGNSSATVFVSCRPAMLGTLDGQLNVTLGTQPQYVAAVPLLCAGGGPRIVVTPDPLDFGTVPYNSVGSAVTRRRLMVSNFGTTPTTPGDPQYNLFLGANGALPWFSIVPRNAHTRVSEFNVGLISTYDADAGLSAVPGQNHLEFEVQLAPSSADVREADLLVYSNDSDTPVLTVPMTATPRAPESCTIVADVETVNFGPTPRGATVTRDVRLTNTSAVAGNQCLVSGIELTPGSDLAFSVIAPTDGALLIASGQTKVITVQAAVDDAEPWGAYLRGALRFSVGNDGTSRSLPVALEVSHCLLIDPAVVNLGVVQESCTSASRAVTLYNVCNVPIDVELPTAATPFTSNPVSPGLTTLAAGQSLGLSVAIAPTTSTTWNVPLTFRSVEAGVDVFQSISLRATSTPDGLQQDTFMQAAAAVDILFVVDDSCSMGDEQAALSTNFASFISAATQGVGDWHLGVTTTDLYGQQGRLYGTPSVLTPATPNVASAFAANVSVGIAGSGFEQPFACMAAAFSADNLARYNTGFVRSNAALAVVIVTDAVEQSPNTTDAYIAQLRALKGNVPELVTVSVVGPFTPSGNGCSVEGVDNGRYLDITTQTGGARADICTGNWSTALQSISSAVFGSRRSFSLSGTARAQADTTVTVGGTAVTSGWHLDVASNSVVFDSPPAAGQAIVISYATACF